MKTKQLFGVKFINSPHYKNQILDNFKDWKKERQETLDFEDKQLELLIHRVLLKVDESNHTKAGRTWEDLDEEMIKELKRDVALKGWNTLFESEIGGHTFRRKYCNISFDEAQELLIHENCEHFWIANTVINESKKIQITEPLDLEWLEPTPDGKRQLNFGDHFIRYMKRGPKIVALAAHFTPRQECGFIIHTFFHFDLAAKTETLVLMGDYQTSFYDRIVHKGFDRESHDLLFQLIAFMELAPKHHVYLPPREKYDDEVDHIRVKNQENYPMTYVRMDWNRSVHYGEIPVQPHLKMQPCGPRSADRKRILVLFHTREGYNLKVQKILQAQA